MNWIRGILALVFGGVFVYAGAVKAADPSRFLIDIRSFDMLPDPFAAWMALGLPWLELLCGLAVILGVLRRGALLILNLALVVFFVAIGIAKSRGLDIHCGCFGGADAASSYTGLFIRDGLLLVTGFTLMWLCRVRRVSVTA